MACHHDPPPHDCNEASGLWNETRVFQIQLQRLAFQGKTFATMLDGMAIRAPMTQIPLLPFTIPSLSHLWTQALASQFGQVLIGEPPVWEKEGIA
ncbi:MAG: hypothetical protein CO149_01455 [Nitrospirae bacterium CG_4_9_14_3_um_filter_51_5]|nr:MAG: hypothetical protein CO149_01455 [Nitrospirae bacterium CG_4_9_14_3_um_filter_51_5]